MRWATGIATGGGVAETLGRAAEAAREGLGTSPDLLLLFATGVGNEYREYRKLYSPHSLYNWITSINPHCDCNYGTYILCHRFSSKPLVR